MEDCFVPEYCSLTLSFCYLFISNCQYFIKQHSKVQEKSTKSPVQGDRTGHIPVFDRLLADNLRSSAAVRSHTG